ncbi:transporter [Undibacterium sp. RTI2.1]|uniref:transporter n=1 Tax=unclassified Undibacterium TaxID=2630295 RepID=UPI002AB464AC|nr:MULTISPECIES: transporter [unclassified Undibacterium]MDY7539821.1 transporter [Undibacterium sp. 5I1]MEB0029390.1 transporter [Undibacterium sp. RTI2.1]MEB0115991.1 transporter [Undibacterium sp. RTI2.2]MEB0232110.1 transporter [Undibacterium sp. 10I3]MEB0256857.1 transporter [Undibacterium sp. 5I1]
MQIDQLSYGSDLSGLICGYVFVQGQAGQVVHTPEALAWLQKPAVEKADAFIWLHFNLSNVAAEKWLHEHTDLPEEFYEALHEGSRSTRIEHADNGLIAVVNDVLHDFAFDVSDIATLWLSLTNKVLISARRKPLQSVDRLRNAVNQGELFHSPTELLTHLFRDQADVLIGIVRNAIKKVDEIEDKLLAERLNHKRARLGELRRVLVRLQRLLAPEPAALFRLLKKPPVWVAESDVEELRQSTEEFAVVLSDMASLQERIKLLQEEIAAGVNEQNNRSLFVLTIVTVLALPINIIAGLFGMNVGGIPLAQHEHGFWIVVAIVATFTVIAGWLAFRNRD